MKDGSGEKIKRNEPEREVDHNLPYDNHNYNIIQEEIDPVEEEEDKDALGVAADEIIEIDDDQLLEDETPTIVVDDSDSNGREQRPALKQNKSIDEEIENSQTIMTQEDMYMIEQRGSPQKKRILIKSSVSTNNAIVQNNSQVPPRQPSSGRRRPPTAGQRLDSARSNKRPPKSGGRISGPSTNTMKMLDPPLIFTQEPGRDGTDDILDQIFDSLTPSLAQDNTQKIDEGLYLRQYADKLRMEAIAKYQKEEIELVQRFESTQRALELNKETLTKQKEQLLILTKVHENKAEQMIDSMSQLLTKDFSCAPFCDQGWKLLQNWIFSLITDQEKGIRYSKMKLGKQLEHVTKEKQRYQENRVTITLQQVIQNLKQIPMAKIHSVKSLKTLNENVQSQLQEIQPGSVFEHVGTIRSKPYIKLSSYSLQYRIGKESFSKMPNISTLLQDSGQIIEQAEQILNISSPKINLNQEKYQQLLQTKRILNSLISNEILQLFQDPEVTSKREQRVFVCAKEANDIKKLSEKQEIKSFKDFLSSGSWTFPVTDQCSIKRIKNTNQLKITLGTDFCLLSECRMSHLLNSNVFMKYFDKIQSTQTNIIRSFYVIEENSLFSLQNSEKIINAQRKIKHFRKLSDFEILLLINKSLGYLIQNTAQQIEVKISQDLMKRLAIQSQSDSVTSDMTFSHIISNLTGDKYVYKLVDCLTENGQLLKQYLIRYQLQNPQIQPHPQEPAICLYPNCLQCIQNLPHHDFYTQKSHLIQNVNLNQQQLVQIKKPRPESAGAVSRGQPSNRREGGPKRLARLSLLIELDLAESPFVKLFGKRFKIPNNSVQQQQQQPQVLVKDKSTKSIISAGGSSNNAIGGGNSSTFAASTIDPGKSITLQRRESTSMGVAQVQYCVFHFEMERFLSQRLNQNIIPICLRPNTLHKALKTSYLTWKDDIKSSLASDLFQKHGANSKKSQLQEFFDKIISLSLNTIQSLKLIPEGGPGNNFVDVVFSQQPQMINVLENYYAWIQRAASLQKLIYYKNPAFREAQDHLMAQVDAFNMNLKQAGDNELFLTNELKRWLQHPQHVSTILQTQLFPILQETLRSKDVLFKFQQFQSLSDKVNANTALLMSMGGIHQHSFDQQILPKIGIQDKFPGQQTHSLGFFPRQESFASGKNMEKLNQIYGPGQSVTSSAGNLGPKKGNNGGSFTQQLAEHMRQTAVVYDMISTTTSKNIVIGQQLQQPIMRKQSAGNKRDQAGEGVSHQHYFSYQNKESNTLQSTSNNDRNAHNVMDSPHSNKTYKQMTTKTEIMLPPTTINSGVVFQKQRASSAHKNNQQQQNQLLGMSGTITQTDQYGIRAGTNTSIYEMKQGGPLSHSQLRNSKQQYTDVQAQALAVASTFQQPPPKFLGNTNVLLQSLSLGTQQQQALNPLQQIYGVGGRMPARPITGGNLISSQGQGNKPLALKHLERQQIIVNTYSQPTQVNQPTRVGNPNSTSQGFNPQTLPQPQRIASANQQHDREKKKMQAFEKQAHSKKSKKKQHAMKTAQEVEYQLQQFQPSGGPALKNPMLEDYYLISGIDQQQQRPYTQGQ